MKARRQLWKSTGSVCSVDSNSSTSRGHGRVVLSRYLQLEAQNQSFTALFAYDLASPVGLRAGDQQTREWCQSVSAAFFPTLGIAAQRGRLFDAQDEQAGAAPVVILTEALLQRLGLDVGARLELNSHSFRFVGSVADDYPRVDRQTRPYSFRLAFEGCARRARAVHSTDSIAVEAAAERSGPRGQGKSSPISARGGARNGTSDSLPTAATIPVVLTSTSKDSAARAGALAKKIASLESLASNLATTAAESESAQKAAQRLRLQLAQLVAAAEADPDSGQPEPPQQGFTPESGAEPLPAGSPSATRMWLWLLPGLALVGVLLVLFWPRGDRSAASVSEPRPRVNHTETAPERSERERAAAAILADISRTRGAAAAAQAQRACRARDLVKEFQNTPGGVLQAKEDSVDVRRRCGAYLSVRGFDEEACFLAGDGRPQSQCPIPD